MRGDRAFFDTNLLICAFAEDGPRLSAPYACCVHRLYR